MKSTKVKTHEDHALLLLAFDFSRFHRRNQIHRLMKSTKVKTHEDHALLLLPRTAILSQMKHKSMLWFLNVLRPLVNLRQKKKTAVSRTNSASIVANQAIWCKPVTRKEKMMPDHVTLSPLAPPPPKRKHPWMKTTPVLMSPPCIMMSTQER